MVSSFKKAGPVRFKWRRRRFSSELGFAVVLIIVLIELCWMEEQVSPLLRWAT